MAVAPTISGEVFTLVATVPDPLRLSSFTTKLCLYPLTWSRCGVACGSPHVMRFRATALSDKRFSSFSEARDDGCSSSYHLFRDCPVYPTTSFSPDPPTCPCRTSTLRAFYSSL